MSITREEIAAAYLTLLGRKPESETVYTNAEALETVEVLARRITESPEFLNRLLGRLYTRIPTGLRPLTEDKIVYLHVPKCGGTTLHSLLEEWYGAAAMHPERHNGLYYCGAAQLATKRVFSGHFDFYSTQLVPGHRRLISFLRDPRDRLVSLYNFHRAHRPDIIERDNLVLARWARQYDIDAYFAAPEVRAHPAVNNAIARYFSNVPQVAHSWTGSVQPKPDEVEAMCAQSLTNLDAFDFIGFMDCYDESVSRLADLLGMPQAAEIKRRQVLDDLMTSNPGMEKIEKQYPSAQTIERMEELIVSDRLIYTAAREKFAR